MKPAWVFVAIGLLPTILLVPGGSAGEPATRLKLAVLDLKDNGVGAEAASLLTGIVCNKLSSFGLFDVISREDIKNILTHEEDRILLGCSDEQCLVKLGGALGADDLVAGTVGMVGTRYVIGLQRIEMRGARVAKRVERQFDGSRERLLEEIANAAHQVVEDILKAESGTLLLSVSEEGADVSVDSRLVGTSPIKNLEVPAGPHDLRVAKAGFIDWVRTIQMRPRDVQSVDVTLIPSAKFIETYEQGAGKMRRWAWISAVAFLALEAGALGLRTHTWQTYDPIEERYNAGDFGNLSQQQYYDAHRDEMKTAEIMDYAALGMGISGVLIGALSAYLFIQGDDPNRYERFRGMKGASTAIGSGGVTLGIGAGDLGLRWEF